jgi:hypothetical protein
MAAGTGRKAADLAANGRDAIWAAIRARTEPFTVADLTALTDTHGKTVRDYCKGLAAAGYLRSEPALPGQVATWSLVRDIGHEAPRVRLDGTPVTQGVVTEQLWRGMYILKEFTFRDLIETASIVIPEDTARAYCKMLLATGYLKVLRKADPSKDCIARYRLIRNNGPRPPQIQRVKRVFDPNSREVFMPESQL